MATFQFEAMNSVGQPVKGEVDAASSEEAINKVRSMGNFPTKIKERSSGKKSSRSASSASKAGAAPEVKTGKGRRAAGAVSVKLMTTFTRQLSTLIDAGLPILRSLRILEQQQKPGMLRVAIRLVAEDVEGGATLSEAMSRHPKAFDRLYVNMVKAGELGGVLDTILQRLSEFMERSLALKRKIVGAMIYPVAVISFALLIVSGLLMFVIPSFEKIFKDMGSKLPALTQSLIDLSSWMTDTGWMYLVASPVAIWGILKFARSSAGGRYLLDKIKIKIPIMGQIICKTAVARFARTLGTLLAAGVPILDAITITSDTSGNEVFARALKKVRDSIREGESFADPLRQARIVDAMVVNMIDVGEETGELDKMLVKVADTYDEEVGVLVASMVSLLEPIMVITLGLIVGVIVVSLFMPMVGLLQDMQKK